MENQKDIVIYCVWKLYILKIVDARRVYKLDLDVTNSYTEQIINTLQNNYNFFLLLQAIMAKSKNHTNHNQNRKAHRYVCCPSCI